LRFFGFAPIYDQYVRLGVLQFVSVSFLQYVENILTFVLAVLCQSSVPWQCRVHLWVILICALRWPFHTMLIRHSRSTLFIMLSPCYKKVVLLPMEPTNPGGCLLSF